MNRDTNKRKFGVGRGFSGRGKARSPPEKRSRRDNVGNSSQGIPDRVVRMRDHRRQPLAGDGAEKEFPRAWGLLHETMKTKFGIDKLDFSTTTLQLTGHDDVIHRCTVKIYKPRNFQATGEGYSSRVAESRCAAMACITLRDLGVLPGGTPNNTAVHWQQPKQEQFDPLEPLCITIPPEWQNKLFEAIMALPECGHFVSYQRLAQYFGQPVKRKSLLQAPTTPATPAQNFNGASQQPPPHQQQFPAQQKYSFKQQQSFDEPRRAPPAAPKPLFPELTGSHGTSKDDRAHEPVSSHEPAKDSRPKKFELCLKSQTSGEESSFSLLLPPNVAECFPSSQMIQCPSCSVWVSISLRKTQVDSHSFTDHSDSKGLVISTSRSSVGYDRHEDQHSYRQDQFHGDSHESTFGNPPVGTRGFQSGIGSAQDISHPGKGDGEIYDIFTGQLYVAITPGEAQDRCREMARGLSIIRASTNVCRDNAARLPIATMRSRVVNLVNEHQVVIVHGPPGCGKTTQVPQFLLEDYTDSGRGSYCNVIIAHPHRVVAMASSERISAERNEKLGDSVGYEVDVGYCIPTNSGRVMFCTNEVLLAKIRLNPLLMGVSHVIVDEANERRIHSDFLLAVLKLILPNRHDLKLIILTTTDQADNMANYFFNMRFQQPAMCVEIPVETPAVNMYYINDIEQLLHWRPNMESSLDEGLGAVTDVNIAMITRLILHIADTQLPGNILVLLPGLDDILAVRVALQNALRLGKDQLVIVLLHSKLAVTELQKVHQRSMVQIRKVILADHLAESSVSVDNISFVICSGKIKEIRYDPIKKTSAYISTWCTRLNIDHQCHNAAFARPCGTCYCLFTKRDHQEMIDRPVAQIHQTSLERVALLSKILYPNMQIADIMSKIIEPAPVMSVTMAINNLVAMGALDESESLTPLGTAMASLSADPKISKMLLLAASLGVIEPVLTVAAWFDCSDPFVLDDIPIQQQIEGRLKYVATTNSDQLALVNAYNGWMHSQFTKTYADSHCLHMASLLMIKGLKEHFTSEMLGLDIGNPELFNRHASSEHMVKATLCAGLYPNLLRCYRNERDDQWGRGLMETKLDGSVDKHPFSVATLDTQQQYSWFVFHQKVISNPIMINEATIVDPVLLLLFAGNGIEVVQQDGDEVLISLDGDDWLVFRTMAITADILDSTRRGLQAVVDHFITASTTSAAPQPYIAFTKCVADFLDSNPCTIAHTL